MTTTRPDAVISATALRTLLDSGADVVLLDIRRDADRGLRHEYEAGHLPGAHYVEHSTQLAGVRTPESGKNPLPTDDQIQAAVTGWGIHPSSTVVVYTRGAAPPATRAWWVLTWAGVPDVRYLDGGLDAWTAAGGELTTDEPAPGGGTFQVRTGSLPTIDADEAGALARSGLLLDARPREAYLGDAEQPGQGHIPGAVSVPYSDNLDEDGLLRNDESLRALYAGHGVDGIAPLGLYCGGGVGATTGILVLHRLGIPAALYPGSWTQWSADPTRPVATGTEPG
ncbi:sulfurtransferase [Dactylosporangium fulvum]|uniref:thiosulfate sulfurtransferase n=1 Tax=Dactylosporangium fulvum TaxID=53359 RepID=A0ABY5WD29_9ACTN|nr:sulfurtransferase [Dactylosporangium fulvum]UWP86683.1 sulfurtransferase [Dactylosporangium fulvum]